ncbi:MAG: phenylacetate--CoA ligase family protein [Hyphomicrobiaceae bacterium]
MTGDHYDALEQRTQKARDKAIFALLPDILTRAIELAPGWATHLSGITPGSVTSRAALAKLPVLRKASLKELQGEMPPFGGFATSQLGDMRRAFLSPGPIFEPEGRGEDWWRSARTLYAAGFRRGDVVHNTFSYHLTPGGWIMDAGARALGCAVFPAGPGNTEQQLDAIHHLRPTAYIGVPDFLKILLDKAAEAQRPITSFKRAMVSGGALFPSLRAEYQAHGIDAYQCYATADLGVIAYESVAREGMIVDEGVIVEIVRPGTGTPVEPGEVGEVVVTSLNRDYPMIRLATGDLSAVLEGDSPCGRTNMRIKGWMGRADQTTKVKGMFVHPEHVAAVGARHPELGRLRLVVARDGAQDAMTLMAESTLRDAELMEAVSQSLQDITKLRGSVQLVDVGTLANDGKVISDDRDYTT